MKTLMIAMLLLAACSKKTEVTSTSRATVPPAVIPVGSTPAPAPVYPSANDNFSTPSVDTDRWVLTYSGSALSQASDKLIYFGQESTGPALVSKFTITDSSYQIDLNIQDLTATLAGSGLDLAVCADQAAQNCMVLRVGSAGGSQFIQVGRYLNGFFVNECAQDPTAVVAIRLIQDGTKFTMQYDTGTGTYLTQLIFDNINLPADLQTMTPYVALIFGANATSPVDVSISGFTVNGANVSWQ